MNHEKRQCDMTGLIVTTAVGVGTLVYHSAGYAAGLVSSLYGDRLALDLARLGFYGAIEWGRQECMRMLVMAGDIHEAVLFTNNMVDEQLASMGVDMSGIAPVNRTLGWLAVSANIIQYGRANNLTDAQIGLAAQLMNSVVASDTKSRRFEQAIAYYGQGRLIGVLSALKQAALIRYQQINNSITDFFYGGHTSITANVIDKGVTALRDNVVVKPVYDAVVTFLSNVKEGYLRMLRVAYPANAYLCGDIIGTRLSNGGYAVPVGCALGSAAGAWMAGDDSLAKQQMYSAGVAGAVTFALTGGDAQAAAVSAAVTAGADVVSRAFNDQFGLKSEYSVQKALTVLEKHGDIEEEASDTNVLMLMGAQYGLLGLGALGYFGGTKGGKGGGAGEKRKRGYFEKYGK